MKKLTGLFVLIAALILAFAAYTLSEGDKGKAELKVKQTTEEMVSVPVAELNKPAPIFTLMSADGKKHSLAGFKGKWVVLEWVNYDCPFVKKHYGSENMQNLQLAYLKKDVAWLSICSSAPGHQGYFEGEALNERITEENSAATAYLIDVDGKVGHMYEAKTTPHMFIINPKGILVYAGAIDDKPSTKVADIEGATNYVKSALDAAMTGKEISVSSSVPYGCSVKYSKK